MPESAIGGGGDLGWAAEVAALRLAWNSAVLIFRGQRASPGWMAAGTLNFFASCRMGDEGGGVFLDLGRWGFDQGKVVVVCHHGILDEVG